MKYWMAFRDANGVPTMQNFGSWEERDILYSKLMESGQVPDVWQRHYVKLNDIVEMELGYSEVCMHMHVAGTLMSVLVTYPQGWDGRYFFDHWPMAQLIQNGRNYSAPITMGEAGFYRDANNNWYYDERNR